jgi:hypothetical protein
MTNPDEGDALARGWGLFVKDHRGHGAFVDLYVSASASSGLVGVAIEVVPSADQSPNPSPTRHGEFFADVFIEDLQQVRLLAAQLLLVVKEVEEATLREDRDA